VSEIDWMNTPLESFLSAIRKRADGTTVHENDPLGDGQAQRLLVGLLDNIGDAYYELLPEEEYEGFEKKGEVPFIRNGRRTHEALDRLTLRDLPSVLDTLVILEEEDRRRQREDAERKAAERKERERVRAKERRKLRKLGEW
jgi:hypothetical protein